MRIDNELPGDQAGDDALSACFDTAPLTEDLQVLGRPRVRIAFTVNRPVAQIVGRLCDVAPDGVSQRISLRAFNLTHLNGHDAPQKLVPGQRYEAEFTLSECAHLLRPGHVLRLALSTSYWPIVWPAPEASEITLDLAGCALILPERSVSAEIAPQAPGPAQPYPTLGGTELRAPSGTSETKTLEDGTLVLDTFDDYGEAVNPHNGQQVGSHVTMHYAIHPDDPATATFKSDWRFTFARGDWQVAIDTENKMTCDTQNFYLWRRIHAYEGGASEPVLVKEWNETVPRGCL